VKLDVVGSIPTGHPNFWIPCEGSNLDQQLQRLRSYH
jgi:hypothetical protein